MSENFSQVPTSTYALTALKTVQGKIIPGLQNLFE
jgi:hypothetical protein